MTIDDRGSSSAETELLLPELSPARRAKLAALPRRKYLRTPEWERTSEAAIQVWSGECNFCGRPGCRINRLAEVKAGGRETKYDMHVLCTPCDELYGEG